MLYRHRIHVRWVWRVSIISAVVAWLLLIFYTSSLTQDQIGPGGTFQVEPMSSLGRGIPSLQDHLIMYAVLASLIQVALHSFNNSTSRILPWAFVSAGFAILYGVSDEFHQSFVDGRSASIMDVFWDGLGAVATAVILGYLMFTWPRPRGQQARWALLRRRSSVQDS